MSGRILHGRYLRTAWIAALAVSSTGFVSAQAPSQEKPANAPSANEPAPTECAQIASEFIPLDTTLQAKVTGFVSSGHLKPGKKIWFNAVRGMVYPGCRLETDAAIYATVVAASSSKDSGTSEISLKFDSADCTGHDKQAMKFYLVGIVAAPADAPQGHDAAPTQVAGSGRQISDAAANTNGYDARLGSVGPPASVHLGTATGFKNLKLEPQGGPQCSARLTSTSRNIELGAGTVLLLALAGAE